MVGHPSVELLPAYPNHAAALSKLHGELFESPWTTGGVQRLLEHPACLALIAIELNASSPVGFIIAQMTADEAEILSVGVKKSHQRQGIGRALVEALAASAWEGGARRLFLDVAEGNAAALALYANLGFTRMGRRKEYYLHRDGDREAALLMVRDLRPRDH